jgi:hypothetical protein
MKTWTKGLLTGLLTGAVIISSLPALAAGPYCRYPDRREIRLQQRLYHGLRSGRLTPGEYRRLEHRQHRIRLAEARMLADGHLDRWERARLHAMHRYNHNSWRPGW